MRTIFMVEEGRNVGTVTTREVSERELSFSRFSPFISVSADVMSTRVAFHFCLQIEVDLLFCLFFG